jgi:hypothetical protein
MVRLLKPEVQAHFLDADVKFAGDGGYSVTQK